MKKKKKERKERLWEKKYQRGNEDVVSMQA